MGRRLSAEEAAQLEAGLQPAPPKRRFSPEEAKASGLEGPSVSPAETFVSSAVGMLPLANPIVNALAAVPLRAAGALSPAYRVQARLTPQAQAELRAMGEQVPPQEAPAESLKEAYRLVRAVRAERERAGETQNPGAATAGKGTGLALSLLAPLPKAAPKDAGSLRKVASALLSPAPKGAKLLQRVGASAKAGATFGGLGALTGGDADLTRGETGEALLETAQGAALGGALGTALPVAGALAKGTGKVLYRTLKGVVRPTPEARALQALGVPLTTGQMNPKSGLAQFEEVGAYTGGVGPAIQRQREEGMEAMQDVALNLARAPGTKPLPPTVGKAMRPAIIGRRLEEIAQGYDEAYDAALKGEKVWPLTPGAKPGTWHALASTPETKGAFELAATSKGLAVSPSTRRSVLKFLNEELEQLPQSDTRALSAEKLHRLRSNIGREKRRKLAGTPSAEDSAAAILLERAEAAVDGALESQLPPEKSQALRKLSQGWREFKVLQRAVDAARNSPKGFTPAQLSRADHAGANVSAYARGQRSSLGTLGAWGQAVFDAQVPKTGVLPGIAGTLRFLTGPLAAAGNLPGPQRFLTGRLPFQRSLRGFERQVSPALQRAGAALPAMRAPYELPGAWVTDDASDEELRQRALLETLRQRR